MNYLQYFSYFLLWIYFELEFSETLLPYIFIIFSHSIKANIYNKSRNHWNWHCGTVGFRCHWRPWHPKGALLQVLAATFQPIYLSVCWEKRWKIAEVPGTLRSMGKTQMGFQAPDFSLAQARILQPFGEWIKYGKISIYPSLFVFFKTVLT